MINRLFIASVTLLFAFNAHANSEGWHVTNDLMYDTCKLCEDTGFNPEDVMCNYCHGYFSGVADATSTVCAVTKDAAPESKLLGEMLALRLAFATGFEYVDYDKAIRHYLRAIESSPEHKKEKATFWVANAIREQTPCN